MVFILNVGQPVTIGQLIDFGLAIRMENSSSFMSLGVHRGGRVLKLGQLGDVQTSPSYKM